MRRGKTVFETVTLAVFLCRKEIAMTTVKLENGRSLPLDVAIAEARAAYFANEGKNIRNMTTEQLEHRKAVLGEYVSLLKIKRVYTGVEYR